MMDVTFAINLHEIMTSALLIYFLSLIEFDKVSGHVGEAKVAS